MQPSKKIRLTKNEAWLIVLPLLLSVIGLVFIYSASYYNAENTFSDKFYFLKKQGYAFIVGVFFMFLASKISTEKIEKISPVLYLVSLVLLALVFVPKIGVENYGAKRWLNFGFFTIQPSEIAKFALVCLLSRFASKSDMTSLKNVVLFLLIGLFVMLLIIVEPNMSITVCVGLVVLTLLLLTGASLKHFSFVVFPATLLVPVLILIEPYRLKRLKAFINPWGDVLGEGYQLVQSYYALSSGGLFGVGLFNSRQKFAFLPFAESDFIFAIIGEEIGFVGALFVAMIFLKYVYEGFKVSKRAVTRFDSYLAMGITLVIAFQSSLNIAVVCGAIPPTGLPLPYVSSGGSSLVSFLVASGVLLGISKKAESTQIFLKP